METVSIQQWKQAKEGIRRGDYTFPLQINYVDTIGKSIQTYIMNDGIVMRMTSTSDIKVFELHQNIIDATSYIYIPSDQDYEDWDEQGLDIEQEIANRE